MSDESRTDRAASQATAEAIKHLIGECRYQVGRARMGYIGEVMGSSALIEREMAFNALAHRLRSMLPVVPS